MNLYINGQDIHELTIAIIDKDFTEESVKKFETGPEGFLKTIGSFLDYQNIGVKEIKKIYVVIGDGSATALRSILSILNTLSFVKGTELIAIEKEKHEQDLDSIKKILNETVEKVEHKNVLLPKYSFSPRITVSTKDVLRRKK